MPQLVVASLALRRTGHGSGKRLENLGFDRKIVAVHFVRHAVGAVVQIAQTEILREDVLHLMNELAIAAAYEIRVIRSHRHGRPTGLHAIGGISVRAWSERVKIDVDDGVAAGLVVPARTSVISRPRSASSAAARAPIRRACPIYCVRSMKAISTQSRHTSTQHNNHSRQSTGLKCLLRNFRSAIRVVSEVHRLW
jgi:hypothetical protein